MSHGRKTLLPKCGSGHALNSTERARESPVTCPSHVLVYVFQPYRLYFTTFFVVVVCKCFVSAGEYPEMQTVPIERADRHDMTCGYTQVSESKWLRHFWSVR
jgi:hypothetical protein